jgi:hypothetical protein
LFIAGDGRTDIVVREGLLSLAPCRNGPVASLAAGQTATVDNSCTVTVTSDTKTFQQNPAIPRRQIIRPPRQKPEREHPSRSKSSG